MSITLATDLTTINMAGELFNISTATSTLENSTTTINMDGASSPTGPAIHTSDNEGTISELNMAVMSILMVTGIVVKSSTMFITGRERWNVRMEIFMRVSG